MNVIYRFSSLDELAKHFADMSALAFRRAEKASSVKEQALECREAYTWE